MSLKNCPDCGGDLGRSALKCRCGWSATKKGVPLPDLRAGCAHEGCATLALVRVKVETGWANFCEYHYIQNHTAKAQKWCEENGLHTTQQKIEFCRKMSRFAFKSMPGEREPGQDDEEMAA